MGKVIQFQPRESIAYFNLSQIIKIAESIEALNFYEETAKNCEEHFAYGEYEKIQEEIRTRRLELAKPEPQEPEQVEHPGVYTYTPEMGQTKPDCQMEASRAYYGKHVFIDTPLEIKGRGIRFVKKYEDKDFTIRNHYKVGWNEYCVTNLAYEKLKEQYSISMQCCLD